MMQGWYYVESLTGQRHDRVEQEYNTSYSVGKWFHIYIWEVINWMRFAGFQIIFFIANVFFIRFFSHAS